MNELLEFILDLAAWLFQVAFYCLGMLFVILTAIYVYAVFAPLFGT